MNESLVVRNVATPIDSPAAYGALIELARGARVVCLGEASHGTHEFYQQRALITRRLISEAGFNAVAVEADWPDAYRVNRYVRGETGSGAPPDSSPNEALSGFVRFPTWIWRNTDVVEFTGWLRNWNDSHEPGRHAGFYGLDLYSLNASIEAVLAYLDRVDPDAARRARCRYGCFEDFGEDAQAYGYAAEFGLSPACEREVIEQLVELRRRASGYSRRDGRMAADEYFFAEQNARLVKNAEEYYRALFRGRTESWNTRDRHMSETLAELSEWLMREYGRSRIVVWAHNSHTGDASKTESRLRGELNLGQLTRERLGAEAVLIGFTTYAGTVAAAAEWGGPVEEMRVHPALPESWERLLHDAARPRFVLTIRENGGAADLLAGERLERAIGVIYRPRSERASHYFAADLMHQFDAVIHIDETTAVIPLERSAGWGTDLPETYPLGV